MPSKEWEIRMRDRMMRGEPLARNGPVVGPGENGKGSGREGIGGGSRRVPKRRREEEEEDEDDDDDVVYQGSQSTARPERPSVRRRMDMYMDEDEDEDEEEDDDGVVYQGMQRIVRPGPGPRPGTGIGPRSGAGQSTWQGQAQQNNGQASLPAFANSSYTRPNIIVESAEFVRRKLIAAGDLRGSQPGIVEQGEEDYDDDGDERQNASGQLPAKIRRFNPSNNQNATSYQNTPPQNSSRRPPPRKRIIPCERCRRLHIGCGEVRPCANCIRVGEFCTDAMTGMRYNTAGPPLVNNVFGQTQFNNEFEQPPFNNPFGQPPAPPPQPRDFQNLADALGFYDGPAQPAQTPPQSSNLFRFFDPPSGNAAFNFAPPPTPPPPSRTQQQHNPWDTLQNDADAGPSNIDFGNIPGAENDGDQNEFIIQINEDYPLSLSNSNNVPPDINLGMNITATFGNQGNASVQAQAQEQVDRRLEELRIASQSWATVEPALPATGSGSRSGSHGYFGDSSADAGLGQNQNQPTTGQGAGQGGLPELNADFFETDYSGDSSGGQDLDPRQFEELDLENMDFTAMLEDRSTPVLDAAGNLIMGPPPDPRIETELQEGLDRQYRRSIPRNSSSSNPPLLGAQSMFDPRNRTSQPPASNTSFSPFQPRRPPGPTARGSSSAQGSSPGPAQTLGPFATWSWATPNLNPNSNFNPNPSPNPPSQPWPFTKIPRAHQPHPLGIYADLTTTSTCDEAPCYIAFPDLGHLAIHVGGRDKCGETPARQCEVVAAAQREHVGVWPAGWNTCLECYGERRRRWDGAGLERRKAFLCKACAGVVRREDGMGNGAVRVKEECGCRRVVGEMWLCHLHGEEVEGEWRGALANAEATIIAMGRDGACVACGVGWEDRESGVWSCKVCRDWVWSTGNAGEAGRAGGP